MNSPSCLKGTARRFRRRVSACAAFAISAICATKLFAGLDFIIFDPSNFTKNLEQVIALVQQVALASEQIRQQEQMLAHLPASVAGALQLAGQSLQGQLSQTVASGVGPLDSRYPVSFPQPEPAWLDIMRQTWMQDERQRFLHERDLAQQVQDQMAPTSGRLTTIIEASNGIGAKHGELPGQVAAAQAHVELLAACSGEADKLLALRTAQATRYSGARAQSQSESAYQSARRDLLMADWNTTGKTKAVRNPFRIQHD